MRRRPLPSSLPRFLRFALFGPLAFAAGGFATLRAEDLVTVRAAVDKDYAAWRAAESPPKPQTFVFVKGRFFAGMVRDRTLEKKPFIDIARIVATDLRRQHYVPTRDTKTADLLVVVHWGVTDKVSRYAEFTIHDQSDFDESKKRIDEYGEAQKEAEATGDVGAAVAADHARFAEEQRYNNLLSDLVSDLSTTTAGAGDNSRLLGLTATDVGNNLFGSEKSSTLKAMAEEERYFIIVTAYDFKVLRETAKPRVLWVARISTRAAGINFNMAVTRLSSAGGDIFGQSTDGLAMQRVQKRDSKIEYGELKVIGMDE